MTDPSKCDITFESKVIIYSYDFLRACSYIEKNSSYQYLFTKKLYSRLKANSHLLEDFLDIHGAKNNKEWFYYRELAATVRHLCISAYAQRHIANRLVYYELPNIEGFAEEGNETLNFINNSLKKLAPEIIKEAERLGISIPEECYNQKNFPNVSTGNLLEHNIDDHETRDHKSQIVKIASEFLLIINKFDQFSFFEPYSLAEIYKIVPSKINEVNIRRYEMQLHNLQSTFDSYVVHGGYTLGNRKLKELRAYISIVLHIIEVQGRLLHFYERHLHELGNKSIYQQVRNKLGEFVSPEELLRITVNYCLYYICHFLNSGKKLAEEILNENIEKSSIRVGIPVTRGFHNRPSLMVAKIVNHFGGKVELLVGEDRFDAGSVLDIQWAGGKIQKEKIATVVFEGDVRALRDIKTLASVNYAEDSMGKGLPLPRELSYLK